MPIRLDAVASRQIAGASLRTFMRLPVAQRSSVILMDVLGCSLQEICEVMDFSLPAVKAALHRGRARLRELAGEPDDVPHPELVGCRARSARRLCRAFQRARFRRHPRHDRGRCAARTRQQDAPERQGRGVPLFRKLFQGQRLASGAGTGRRAARDPGVRSRPAAAPRRNTSCCCNGPPARSLRSATSATRPTSSTAPTIGSDRRANRRRGMPYSSSILPAWPQ